MLDIVELVLVCAVGFILLYLAGLSILALFSRRSSFPESKDFRTFAFVVPAHDEELTIRRTVMSLLAVTYPRDLFEVIVVADNCTDATPRVALQAGALVLERHDPEQKSKGHALRWAFGRLLSRRKPFDAFVVVDADSVVSKNFLLVMNAYLEQGHRSIQAADLVEPRPDAWSSEVSRIALTLYNYVRPLGRKALGWSAGLRGNGMCFAAAALRAVPWQAHSLTEDHEYGLALLLNGITTVFAPEAQVLATMPAKPSNAESQRTRWEAGRFGIIRRYAPQLLIGAIRHGSVKLLDAFIELLTPAFVNIVAFVLAVTLIEALVAVVWEPSLWRHALVWSELLAVAVLYVLVGLSAADADRTLLRAMVYFPRYLAWKLRLYAKLLLRGVTREWVRTTREEKREISALR